MSGMTRIAGVPDADDAKPGMAFFAGTGPEGKTCGKCEHRGYQRLSTVGKAYSVRSCAKFKSLTGRHGPAVDTDWRACKYFEPRAE